MRYNASIVWSDVVAFFHRLEGRNKLLTISKIPISKPESRKNKKTINRRWLCWGKSQHSFEYEERAKSFWCVLNKDWGPGTGGYTLYFFLIKRDYRSRTHYGVTSFFGETFSSCSMKVYNEENNSIVMYKICGTSWWVNLFISQRAVAKCCNSWMTTLANERWKTSPE